MEKKIHVKYKESKILMGDLSEIIQARRESDNIFKIMKEKIQPRILYLAKLSFRYEGGIKVFPNKQRLKEFIIPKSIL